MYILKKCAEQWQICNYYDAAPDYAMHIDSYRINVYSNASGSSPKTYSEWLDICDGFTGRLVSSDQRPNVSMMRNYLYDIFVEMPTEISAFIRYPLYLRPIPYEKLIDDNLWASNEPGAINFVKKVCAIQPVLL